MDSIDMMDIQKVKELVKEYPICQICKENGEDVQFNLYELVLKTERLKREKEWLAEELIELYERYTTTDMPTEEMKKMLFEEMQQALKEG